MFLLYTNDIYNSSEKLSFYLFADDTNLLYADKNLRSLQIVVNEELRNIGNWPMANKLSLNVKKSNFVIFRPYQKRIDYEVNIKIFDYYKVRTLLFQKKKKKDILVSLLIQNYLGRIILHIFLQCTKIIRHSCETN